MHATAYTEQLSVILNKCLWSVHIALTELISSHLILNELDSVRCSQFSSGQLNMWGMNVALNWQEAFGKCWAHSPLRAAARRLFYIAIHQVSLLSHGACASMSTTTSTTTTTRDRGDRYGPMEWAQWSGGRLLSRLTVRVRWCWLACEFPFESAVSEFSV